MGNFLGIFRILYILALLTQLLIFYIITDNKNKIDNKPQNVKIIYKRLDEIKASAFQKLGFKVNIDYPYKLCDFKPAYGFLFPEIIKDYDFWTQSDLDIIVSWLEKKSK